MKKFSFFTVISVCFSVGIVAAETGTIYIVDPLCGPESKILGPDCKGPSKNLSKCSCHKLKKIPIPYLHP